LRLSDFWGPFSALDLWPAMGCGQIYRRASDGFRWRRLRVATARTTRSVGEPLSLPIDGLWLSRLLAGPVSRVRAPPSPSPPRRRTPSSSRPRPAARGRRRNGCRAPSRSVCRRGDRPMRRSAPRVDRRREGRRGAVAVPDPGRRAVPCRTPDAKPAISSPSHRSPGRRGHSKPNLPPRQEPRRSARRHCRAAESAEEQVGNKYGIGGSGRGI
jgi:hypothetical protein